MTNMKERFYHRNQLYYNKNKSLRWDCTAYPKCKAYVIVHDFVVIHENSCHNHGARILSKSKNVRFGLSNRGHLVVHVGDHKFIKHECYKKKIRWTCNKRIQLGCRASLTTHNSVIVRSFLEHNHI